jgi:hypothetical protein
VKKKNPTCHTPSCSSDMMLHTYLDEIWTVRYWKKVALNIIARMVLNSYILYKENYRGPGKLKSRYIYTVSIIESLGEEWLVLEDDARADNPQTPRGIRKFPEKKESNSLAAAQRKGGGDSEQYAPDETRGCMKTASLNTGANCKRCIHTVSHNVM